MAHVDDASRGGRRPLNAHLNLVPYIDLLMTIMTFLVMSAVWTQMATLEIAAGGGVAGATTEQVVPVLVRVTADGVAIDGAPVDGAALATGLRGAKAARVVPDDDVDFEAIARVVDAAKGAGVVDVRLEPGA